MAAKPAQRMAPLRTGSPIRRACVSLHARQGSRASTPAFFRHLAGIERSATYLCLVRAPNRQLNFFEFDPEVTRL